MQAKFFWRFCYSLSIIGLFWAGFVYTSSSTCFGRASAAGCGDVSVGYTLFVVSLALLNFFVAYRMHKYDHLFSPALSLKFSWRGDRHFPASFIIFFVFAAVFLGEYLPVIIGFLGNHY